MLGDAGELWLRKAQHAIIGRLKMILVKLARNSV